jgi:hypothetical protein
VHVTRQSMQQGSSTRKTSLYLCVGLYRVTSRDSFITKPDKRETFFLNRLAILTIFELEERITSIRMFVFRRKEVMIMRSV